ncbi:MAG: peptidyl-prolyl cis-trans isomerase, partial [Candidatus Dadabacteria bacterium]
MAGCVVLSFAACSPSTENETPASPDAIVLVNGRPVTLDDYAAAIGALPKGPNAIRPDDEQIVQSLIDQELLVQHALTRTDYFRDPVIRRRLIQLLMRDVEPGPPNDAELRQFYDAHGAQYAAQRQVRFRQLRFPATLPRTKVRRFVTQLQDANDRERVIASLERIAAIPNPAHDDQAFYTERRLARTYGPSFAEAVLQLSPGDVAGPLRSTVGWHVVWVQDVAAGAPRPFADMRET